MTDLAKIAERAHAVEEQILLGARAIRTAWLLMGQHLHDFLEGKLWEALGYETLAEWLAAPELGMKRSQVYRLVRCYRVFVVERGVPLEELEGLEITKLDAVRPALERGDVETEDALADVRSLARRDLEAKYGPEREEPTRVQCGECGSWVDPGRLAA